jgi:hypothetical protein
MICEATIDKLYVLFLSAVFMETQVSKFSGEFLYNLRAMLVLEPPLERVFYGICKC